MSMHPPPVAVMSASDPGRLESAMDRADLHLCQLSGSPATSTVTHVRLSGASLDYVHLGPAMLLTGTMPKDCYTVLFVLACPQPAHAFDCAKEFADGCLEVFAPGSTIDRSTPAGYESAALTLPIAEFERNVAAHFAARPEALLAEGALLHIPPASQAALRAILDEVSGRVRRPAQRLASGATRARVERHLRAAFFSAIRAGWEHRGSPPTLRIVRRYQRFRQARDFLSAHLHDPVHVDDLCGATGIHRRALEKLFQDYLGLSPTTYIHRQRLHGARAALQQAVPASGVVKYVALEWGFTHFGRFAAEYRALFGENPAHSVASLPHPSAPSPARARRVRRRQLRR